MTIITGQDRSGVIPFPPEPRGIDLPKDPTKAVRADYSMANWRMVAEAIGCVYFTGLHYKCVEGSAKYGESDETHCRLTLPIDYTEVGDVIFIGEGSRVWRVVIAELDQIQFSDADLIHGNAGTGNYNAIKDSLEFMVRAHAKIHKVVTKNEICLGAFDDGLHGDDIQISKAITSTIKDVYDDLYTAHNADGSHKSGVIDNDDLNKNNVLITQGFVNYCKNSDFNINGIESRNYWFDVGTPVVTPTLGPRSAFPQFYLDIDTDALDEGIGQELAQSGAEPGTPVRLAIWLKGDVGGEAVKIQLYTGIESNTLEITLTDEWVKYYLTLIPTDLSIFVARIISNTASAINFYVAKCLIANGDIHTLPERSAQDVLYDACHHLNFYIYELKAAADSIKAKFTPRRAIKMIGVYAYAVTAVNANAIIRLTDGTYNVDVTILNTANQGVNTTTTQEFAAGTELTVKVMANIAAAGGLCNVVYVYRML